MRIILMLALACALTLPAAPAHAKPLTAKQLRAQNARLTKQVAALKRANTNLKSANVALRDENTDLATSLAAERTANGAEFAAWAKTLPNVDLVTTIKIAWDALEPGCVGTTMFDRSFTLTTTTTSYTVDQDTSHYKCSP